MSAQEILLTRANIPKAHWPATASLIPNLPYKKEYIEFVSEVIQREGQNLTLWGPYGAGKSALAALYGKVGIEAGLDVFWISARAVAGVVIDKTEFQGESMEDRIRNCDLLLLDELIVTGKDKFKLEIVEEIIRARVSDFKRTCVTTNNNPQHIDQNAPSVYAILCERNRWIKVAGYNYRLDPKKALHGRGQAR